MGIQERRNREKEERRNHIIEMARKEFLKTGLRSSSIKEIARRAELSPRTIYLYFANKQELYVAVLLNGLKVLGEEIQKIAVKEPDPAKSLELVKDAYCHFYLQHRDYFRIMMFLGFHDFHGEVSRKLCKDISEAVMQCINTVSRIIEQGKDVFSGGSPWKVSWVLWSLFVGIGHVNQARRSLDVGKQDFEGLFDFAYQKVICKQSRPMTDPGFSTTKRKKRR